MANITSELQNAVDNIGSYTLPAGTSQISSTINLGGEIPFWLRGRATSVIEWTGAEDSAMFLFEKTGAGTSSKIRFEHVEAVSEVNGVSIFRNTFEGRPHRLSMEHCAFTTIGAYAVDIDDAMYTIQCHFENMRTFGSGAARIRAVTSGTEPWWFSSLMEIKNWIHDGSDRVGPAFDLRGTRGLKLFNILDRGDPSLLTALRGNMAVPVSLRWNCVAFPSTIHNYVVEYDTDFTNAAGCYLHEIRNDSGTSDGKVHILNIHGMTCHNYDIDSGVKHFRIVGGNQGSQWPLFVTFDACEDMDGDKFLLAGKLLVRCRNIWYNPGESAKAASMQALVESLDTNTWLYPILTATDRPPRETITTPLYVSGQDLYDNYPGATEDDYETILGRL